MKYLKKFEAKKVEYNVGDYVLLAGLLKNPYAKIIQKREEGAGGNPLLNIDYRVELFNNPGNKTIKLWIGNIPTGTSGTGIKRKMTKEEISIYEEKKSSIKFNL